MVKALPHLKQIASWNKILSQGKKINKLGCYQKVVATNSKSITSYTFEDTTTNISTAACSFLYWLVRTIDALKPLFSLVGNSLLHKKRKKAVLTCLVPVDSYQTGIMSPILGSYDVVLKPISSHILYSCVLSLQLIM